MQLLLAVDSDAQGEPLGANVHKKSGTKKKKSVLETSLASATPLAAAWLRLGRLWSTAPGG